VQNEARLTDIVSAATGQVVAAMRPDTRSSIAAGENTFPVLTGTNAAYADCSFSNVDFERIKNGAAKATNRKGCKTKNISPYDQDSVKGWKIVAKCLGGETITVITDLNGSVVDIDVS